MMASRRMERMASAALGAVSLCRPLPSTKGSEEDRKAGDCMSAKTRIWRKKGLVLTFPLHRIPWY